MAEPFLGEIRMFTGKYAPLKWAECNGGLLPIAQHTKLFAVIGVIYGGDGRSTFGLPNMDGCLPVGTGSAPGMFTWPIGMHQGVEEVTLQAGHLSHTHTLRGTSDEAIQTDPEGRVLAVPPGGAKVYSSASSPAVSMHASCISYASGGGKAHSNMMPYQCVNYIICLDGNFPSRP